MHQLTELYHDSKITCIVRNPAWVMGDFSGIYRKTIKSFIPYFCMRLFYCFVLCSVFYSEIVLSGNNPSTEGRFFKNFGNLLKVESQSLTIIPEVIVKTNLDKNTLIAKLNKPVIQLAFLANANIFLVKSADAINYSKELSTKDYIIYAQPNILQKRTYNFVDVHHTSEHKIVERYKKENIQAGNQGGGVNIAIIDDGFNLEHEDLLATQLLFSYDVDLKMLTSNPQLKLDTHGTKVAGIIFAQKNKKGIDGIAPKAKLIAIRQTKNLTSDTILAFTVAAKAGANIINCSWNSPILLEPVYDVIKHLSSDIAIVFAAGNQRQAIKPYSIEASIEEVITVGATQAYSNYGDVVDFVVPGNLETTTSNGRYGHFNGTSASAPIISGLLALKLSQNKTQSIKEIVVDMKKEFNGYR
jgi:subtilisin family serine protease